VITARRQLHPTQESLSLR